MTSQWQRKFDQLIYYNMRNNFLDKSCTKCGGQSISRTFCKKSKSSNSLSFMQFALIVSQFESYLKMLKLSCRPLAFASFKAFLKTK